MEDSVLRVAMNFIDNSFGSMVFAGYDETTGEKSLMDKLTRVNPGLARRLQVIRFEAYPAEKMARRIKALFASKQNLN